MFSCTGVGLPASLAGCYRDVLSGRELLAEATEEGVWLPLAQVLHHLPCALLTRRPGNGGPR